MMYFHSDEIAGKGKAKYVTGVYMHGSLEDILKHTESSDAAYIDLSTELVTGVNECEVSFTDIPCIALIWREEAFPMSETDTMISGYHGLIVSSQDEHAMADALRKYASRAKII